MLTIALIGAATASAPAAAQPDWAADEFPIPAEALTDQHITWAIDALTDGLYRLQSDSGTWERQYANNQLGTINAHAGGQTTLAALALIMAGESYQQARLQPAIDFLRGTDSDHTYVRSLRAHIWALLPDKYSGLLAADTRWLINAYDFDAGSWNYTRASIGSIYDNSLTQYGLLGLWEAAKRGHEVPERLWERIEDHYLRVQLQDGGWNYRPQWSGARGSMTAAGLTCLFITQDYLHAQEYAAPGFDGGDPQRAMQRGLEWLDRNFAADHHPGAPGDDQLSYYFYYLYGIERVGLASGYQRFGEHDWFRECAASIIDFLLQPVRDEDGRMVAFEVKNDVKMTGVVETPIVQLSFALMFLARGRVPIVISKLRDDTLHWNNRPRDAANLTRWISDQTEQPLNWRVLDIDRPLEEWFDGVLVYFASHDPLPWFAGGEESLATNEEGELTDAARLKRYIELGGLVFTNADGRNDRFSESVYAIGSGLFPQYEWRQLPPDHWVYTLSAPVERPPILFGLSNGVRELMIHSPSSDFGLELQLRQERQQRDVFATLGNLYYYASERGVTHARLARKLDLPNPEQQFVPSRAADPQVGGDSPAPRGFTVLRGVYDGAWNAEPAAPELLAWRLLEKRGWAVTFDDVRLDELSESTGRSGRLLWVSGVRSHAFESAEKEGIESFLRGGGTILFEAAGGQSEFGAAAEAIIQSIDEAARFRRQSRHAFITGAGLPDRVDCSTVNYRLFSLERFGGRETRPRIRAASAAGAERLNVFVSREDLSHALLGQPRWGIVGYVTDDAAALLGNLIAYASVREQGSYGIIDP